MDLAQRPSRFRSSAAVVVAGSALGRGSTLVGAILLARTLTPDGFGRLIVAQATVTFLAGVAMLGLATAVTRQVAEARVRDKNLAGAYLSTGLSVCAGASVLVMGTYLLAQHFVANELLRSPGAGDWVTASAAAIAGAALIGCVQGGLLGLEAFSGVALSQAAQGVMSAAGLVIGAAIGDVQGALIGLSIGLGVALAISSVVLRREAAAREITLRLDRTLRGAGGLKRLAMSAFVASVLVSLSLLIVQVILSGESGYAEVGTFNVAYRWHLAVLFVPAAISPILLPMMTR